MVSLESGLRRYLPAETFQPLVWLGLFFGFSALPVAIVYATRSSPAFLALACVTLLADEYRRNPRLSRLRALTPGSLRKPMVMPLLLIAVAAIASALWSALPAHTFDTALRFAGSILLGLSWVVLISRFRCEHILPFLAGGLAVALLVLPTELLSGAGVRGVFTDSIMVYEHNRTIIQLSLLATLFAALAGRSGSRLWMAWAAALLTGSIAAALLTESQAVIVYWLGMGLAAVASGVAPRLSLTLVGLGTGVVVLAFPWLFLLWHEPIAQMAAGMIPAEFARAANADQRLMIWTEFARIVSERPWFGWGLEGERAAGVSIIVESFPQPVRAYHPHSLALELWTGLGLVGAALATAALAGFLRLVARYDDGVIGWAACLFAGSFAVWLISHGAWENWWLAVLAMSLGTLLAIDFYPAEEEPIAPS